MTITRYDPNTIWLGGSERVVINDIAASEAITPGHLIERFNNAGVQRFRKHASAGGAVARVVAIEHAMVNKGVDDDYAANDLVEAVAMKSGDTAWMLIASGQTIVAGDEMESAGNGTLRKLASGVPYFSALENKTVTVLTRLRVEAI